MQIIDNETTKVQYEAAIAELSKHITRATDGTFELDIKDAQEIGMVQEIFDDLISSLEITNELIRRGMIKANDLNLHSQPFEGGYLFV
jgi:hypothetical protein